MAKPKYQQKREAIANALYLYYMNIALNVFKWSNLPEGVESIRLEKYLFERGDVLFFYAENLGKHLTLPSANIGLDVYGEPIAFTVNAPNLTAWQRTIENAVLIKNNHTRTATKVLIGYLLDKLVNVDMTDDVHTKWLQVPIILSGDEKQMLSLKALFEEVEAFKPAIFTSKTITGDNFTSVLNKFDYYGDELTQKYATIESRLLTVLGINNNNVSKKERLVVSEAEANKQQIGASMTALLETRVLACEQINKMFNLNIRVEVNPRLVALGDTETTPEDEPNKEEEDDEQ